LQLLLPPTLPLHDLSQPLFSFVTASVDICHSQCSHSYSVSLHLASSRQHTFWSSIRGNGQHGQWLSRQWIFNQNLDYEVSVPLLSPRTVPLTSRVDLSRIFLKLTIQPGHNGPNTPRHPTTIIIVWAARYYYYFYDMLNVLSVVLMCSFSTYLLQWLPDTFLEARLEEILLDDQRLEMNREICAPRLLRSGNASPSLPGSVSCPLYSRRSLPRTMKSMFSVISLSTTECPN